jgi:ribosome maturation factor RimP
MQNVGFSPRSCFLRAGPRTPVRGGVMAGNEAKLTEALEPICAALSLSLFDVEVRQRQIQVTVEGAGLVELEVLAEAARLISAFLDEHEDLAPAARYDLEVTSPGVERRLRRPEHFIAVIGSPVAIRLTAGTDGPRRIEGTVEAADADHVTIRTEAGDTRTVAHGDIDRAHTVFDWRAALAEHKAETREEARTAPRASKGRDRVATGGAKPR